LWRTHALSDRFVEALSINAGEPVPFASVHILPQPDWDYATARQTELEQLQTWRVGGNKAGCWLNEAVRAPCAGR